ncbi:MAG: hypothetical protein HRU20_18890 [Pseudomonadales bacterium]|nr:hypothetical protein [Pseudomonadales bacterium]
MKKTLAITTCSSLALFACTSPQPEIDKTDLPGQAMANKAIFILVHIPMP